MKRNILCLTLLAISSLATAPLQAASAARAARLNVEKELTALSEYWLAARDAKEMVRLIKSAIALNRPDWIGDNSLAGFARQLEKDAETLSPRELEALKIDLLNSMKGKVPGAKLTKWINRLAVIKSKAAAPARPAARPVAPTRRPAAPAVRPTPPARPAARPAARPGPTRRPATPAARPATRPVVTPTPTRPAARPTPATVKPAAKPTPLVKQPAAKPAKPAVEPIRRAPTKPAAPVAKPLVRTAPRRGLPATPLFMGPRQAPAQRETPAQQRAKVATTQAKKEREEAEAAERRAATARARALEEQQVAEALRISQQEEEARQAAEAARQEEIKRTEQAKQAAETRQRETAENAQKQKLQDEARAAEAQRAREDEIKAREAADQAEARRADAIQAEQRAQQQKAAQEEQNRLAQERAQAEQDAQERQAKLRDETQRRIAAEEEQKAIAAKAQAAQVAAEKAAQDAKKRAQEAQAANEKAQQEREAEAKRTQQLREAAELERRKAREAQQAELERLEAAINARALAEKVRTQQEAQAHINRLLAQMEVEAGRAVQEQQAAAAQQATQKAQEAAQKAKDEENKRAQQAQAQAEEERKAAQDLMELSNSIEQARIAEDVERTKRLAMLDQEEQEERERNVAEAIRLAEEEQQRRIAAKETRRETPIAQATRLEREEKQRAYTNLLSQYIDALIKRLYAYPDVLNRIEKRRTFRWILQVMTDDYKDETRVNLLTQLLKSLSINDPQSIRQNVFRTTLSTPSLGRSDFEYPEYEKIFKRDLVQFVIDKNIFPVVTHEQLEAVLESLAPEEAVATPTEEPAPTEAEQVELAPEEEIKETATETPFPQIESPVALTPTITPQLIPARETVTLTAEEPQLTLTPKSEQEKQRVRDYIGILINKLYTETNLRDNTKSDQQAFTKLLDSIKEKPVAANKQQLINILQEIAKGDVTKVNEILRKYTGYWERANIPTTLVRYNQSYKQTLEDFIIQEGTFSHVTPELIEATKAYNDLRKRYVDALVKKLYQQSVLNPRIAESRTPKSNSLQYRATFGWLIGNKNRTNASEHLTTILTNLAQNNLSAIDSYFISNKIDATTDFTPEEYASSEYKQDLYQFVVDENMFPFRPDPITQVTVETLEAEIAVQTAKQAEERASEAIKAAEKEVTEAQRALQQEEEARAAERIPERAITFEEEEAARRTGRAQVATQEEAKTAASAQQTPLLLTYKAEEGLIKEYINTLVLALFNTPEFLENKSFRVFFMNVVPKYPTAATPFARDIIQAVFIDFLSKNKYSELSTYLEKTSATERADIPSGTDYGYQSYEKNKEQQQALYVLLARPFSDITPETLQAANTEAMILLQDNLEQLSGIERYLEQNAGNMNNLKILRTAQGQVDDALVILSNIPLGIYSKVTQTTNYPEVQKRLLVLKQTIDLNIMSLSRKQEEPIAITPGVGAELLPTAATPAASDITPALRRQYADALIQKLFNESILKRDGGFRRRFRYMLVNATTPDQKKNIITVLQALSQNDISAVDTKFRQMREISSWSQSDLMYSDYLGESSFVDAINAIVDTTPDLFGTVSAEGMKKTITEQQQKAEQEAKAAAEESEEETGEQTAIRIARELSETSS